ncbi:ester hydrolase C11orf54 homolog [Brevipalpus obovatus]|uniref:ester hydrolase C11orf54 homolog n=1 Tax=Brevipalpus obovatus TaxID=246614 RepID=UPI003D9EFDF6
MINLGPLRLNYHGWENFYLLFSLTLTVGMVAPLEERPLQHHFRNYEIKNKTLQVPSFDDIISPLQARLEEHFKFVNVSVVNCPDFTHPPASLAAPGISGTRRVVAQQGGVRYMMPYPMEPMPTYSLVHFAQSVGFKDGAHIIGAGQGPVSIIGAFAESVPNLYYSRDKVTNRTKVIHGTRLIKMKRKSDITIEYDDTGVQSILSDLYITEGKQDKVLKVTAKKRLNDGGKNFIVIIRKLLSELGTANSSAMGGVFFTRGGNLKLHTVPEKFGERKDTSDKVKQWLYVYEGEGVMTCLTTFFSKDLENWDFRLDHTHCYSDQGKGGHYWEDTQPDRIEYEGYFNFATHAIRADQPKLEKIKIASELTRN